MAGYGSTPDNLGVKNNFKHFNPRTGISWRINEQTVARAGYGASTIPFPDNRFAFNYPVKQTNVLNSTNQFQRAGTMAAGFPTPSLVQVPTDGVIPATGSLLNSTYDVIPSDLHEATLHSWNVALQRQLPWNFTADVAYVGNRGVDLVMDVDRNAGMVLGANNAGRPQFAAFGRTGTSRERTNLGKSRYNALQVKVDRRFKNGILITNSYTLGRGWDYTSENTSIATPIDFSRSWGRSDFDRLPQLHAERPVRAAVGPRQEVAQRGPGEHDDRRLAVQQHLRRLLGNAAEHPGLGHAEHARQRALRRCRRRAEGARGARARRAVSRQGVVRHPRRRRRSAT